VDVYRHRDVESSAALRTSKNQRPAILSLWLQPYSVKFLTCACRIEVLKKSLRAPALVKMYVTSQPPSLSFFSPIFSPTIAVTCKPHQDDRIGNLWML
jgi:hypothetical protein